MCSVNRAGLRKLFHRLMCMCVISMCVARARAHSISLTHAPELGHALALICVHATVRDCVIVHQCCLLIARNLVIAGVAQTCVIVLHAHAIARMCVVVVLCVATIPCVAMVYVLLQRRLVLATASGIAPARG